MHINNNVQKIAIENILNQIGEVYTKIGDEVILYPLRIVSGFTNFTESGEFKVNYDTDKFTSDIGVVNSNEPIVCYWEGAYKSYVPTDILGADYQLKEMSAENGKKIKTWIMQYSTELVESEQMINENAYTTIVLNRNIRSFSTDFIPTDNEQKYYLYLYLDKKAKSPQFLKMVSKEPRYLPGGKLAGCEMSFINLNQSYSQSGKDILNFVKMTHPGGNYPFPKEITTEEGTTTILDIDRLNNRGVNDIQLQFWNSYWLNSITVYGAPKSNWKIESPRKLLLVNPHPAISSALDVSGSALNNYYAVFSAQTLYQSFWNNWKDKVQAYYDYGAEKTFMGGWKLKTGTWQDVMDTNPIANDTVTYNMWNNWSFSPKADETFSIPETAFTDNSITFSHETNYKPEDFLNHNSFIFSAMEAMPMEFSETTRYTLGDFGVLGRILQGFVQTFTLGFNPGWTTNNTWVPNKNINFLIPTSTFNFGRLMTAEGSAVGSASIPFDCVNPNFSGCGNKTCTCGYRFQLTRYFQSPSQAIAGNGEGFGGNGIWDTKYLGQTQWENGTWIFANHEPLKWKSDCKAVSPLELNEEYEVFLVSYKGIGLTTCRMTFYNYINNDPANVESVWESIQLTNAKFKNDITLWTNTYKLNFSEEMNNEGLIEYPTNVVPPSPTNRAIRISELQGEFNSGGAEKDISEVNQELWHYRGTALKVTGTSEGKYNHYVIYNQKIRSTIEKTVDLTKLIGVGKLNEYSKFTFKFTSLAAKGTNYNFTKDVSINISDLVDNQWTPIKIAELSEVIAGSNKDAYPNNKFISGGTQPQFAHSLVVLNDEAPIPSSTPIYAWINLNKTTQVMKMNVDIITDNDYPFTDIQISAIGDDTERDLQANVPHIIEDTQEYTGTITGDYIYMNYEAEYQVGGNKMNINDKDIQIPKSIFESGQSYTAVNSYYLFESGINVNYKVVITNVDSTHIKIQRIYTCGQNIHLRIHNRINLVCNHYPRWARRNYKVANNVEAFTGNWKNEYTTEFFRGYKIDDFFINPNS